MSVAKNSSLNLLRGVTNWNSINDLKKDIEVFYENLLGYSVKNTKLINVSESKWEKISQNGDSEGFYLPRNQTAIIKNNSPQGLFHEYFGHGLFCEQTLIGRKLITLEQTLMQEERENFENRNFTEQDLRLYRENSDKYKELIKFKEKNLALFEFFARWSEKLLDEEFGEGLLWEKRYESFNESEKEDINSIINYEKKFGKLATFYCSGFAKHPTKQRLLKLCKDLFSNNLNKNTLVLSFGSKKPFSDIDLYVISDKIESVYWNWLDVRAYYSKDIGELIEELDCRFTDPLMEGELIYGNSDFRKSLQNKLIKQTITEKAIKRNYELAEWNYKRFQNPNMNGSLREKNLRSSKIYFMNAKALENGKKLLTVNNLIDYSNRNLSNLLKGGDLK